MRVFPALAVMLLGFMIPRGESATYYVAMSGTNSNPGTNWITAKQTIQAGVDAATLAGDVVVISNGSYTLAAQVSVTHAIIIRGFSGQAPDVIVNGNGLVRGFNLSAAATVEALTITNCLAQGAGVYMTAGTLRNCRLHGNRGNGNPVGAGGVYMSGGTLTNCDLAWNVASNNASGYDGGALYLTAGMVWNCTFTGNRALRNGGAARVTGGSLVNCTFKHNTAVGGGGAIYSSAGSAAFSNCVFEQNSSEAGAGAVQQSGSATFYGCTFTSNTSVNAGGAISMVGGSAVNSIFRYNRVSGNYDGGAVNMSGGRIRNCLFFGNYAKRWGGAIRADGGTNENCTIVGNQADGVAGGIRNGTNYNCIVYSNTAPSGKNFTGGRYWYSCTYPQPTGSDNLTNSPQFILFGTGYGLSHSAGDYQLSGLSPCIEKGTNLGWMASCQDLAGHRRLDGLLVDIGAYEFLAMRGTVLTIR